MNSVYMKHVVVQTLIHLALRLKGGSIGPTCCYASDLCEKVASADWLAVNFVCCC